MGLALYLTFKGGATAPIYDRKRRIIGRTKWDAKLRRQVFRLPDDPATRDSIIEDLCGPFAVGNRPIPRIVDEETGASADLSTWHKASPPAKRKTAKPVENPTITDSSPQERLAGYLCLLFTEHGKLTIAQAANMLAESKGDVEKAVKDKRFKRSGKFITLA